MLPRVLRFARSAGCSSIQTCALAARYGCDVWHGEHSLHRAMSHRARGMLANARDGSRRLRHLLPPRAPSANRCRVAQLLDRHSSRLIRCPALESRYGGECPCASLPESCGAGACIRCPVATHGRPVPERSPVPRDAIDPWDVAYEVVTCRIVSRSGSSRRPRVFPCHGPNRSRLYRI